MDDLQDGSESTGYGTETTPADEPLSLTDKFIGILTEPSATFDHIRAAGPRASEWVVPMLIMAAILGISMLVRFSNPETAAQMMQQQENAIQKQVDNGKMTQEQADQALVQMNQFSGMTKTLIPIGAAVGYIFVFFVLALVYWLLVRFVMKGEVGFSHILSVVGLSAFIMCIDQIISILLMVVTGNGYANLSPALLMSGGIESPLFRFMMVLAPISLWSQYVAGIGFSRIANITLTKGMIASFIVWLLFAAFTVFTGYGA